MENEKVINAGSELSEKDSGQWHESIKPRINVILEKLSIEELQLVVTLLDSCNEDLIYEEAAKILIGRGDTSFSVPDFHKEEIK